MDCYPHKAQYRPGETVLILTEGVPEAAVRLEAALFHLHREIERLEARPGDPIAWQSPASAVPTAFGVEVYALDGRGARLAVAATAFDVAEAWWRAPRLGFMTDFAVGETLSETQRRFDLLTRLHLNCLHFYDWFFSHHQYLPPEENFVDSLGRELSLITVRRKIRLAHRAGMVALAYGPVYGAEEAFVAEHPDWALYRSDGVPFNVARLFYIMDFRPESPWTRHILGQYVQAVAELGFDGVQIDQYGYPKRALPYPGEMGQASLDLSELFLPFMERAQAALERVKPGARLIFHAVNNWPLRQVAGGPQAANCIQVFSPHETYRDLRDLVRNARALAPEKPVILAAYLKPFQSEPPERAENALRLLTAVIHAAGGYQVLLGEGDGVLTEGYYPHYARLRPEGVALMRRYMDFIVRYGPLLHAPPEQEISETHCGGVTEVFSFEGAPTSPIPRPGAVWSAIRDHGGLFSINLVNLTGSGSGRWNEGQADPPVIRSMVAVCKVLEPVEAVYAATPDSGTGSLVPLPFTVEPDPHSGHVLRVPLPDLYGWNLILISLRT
ncbi:MAG: glycoside hydrolase family 66 protein [Bacillota bacterium]